MSEGVFIVLGIYGVVALLGIGGFVAMLFVMRGDE